jgi:sec-independent protein translocase protein TatB
MFDVNGGEMVVLAGIALVVLGPDKLPGYAAQATRMLRQLKVMADGAKEQVREQMGPEFDDVDWKSLDPRQFDPRRMVREAMSGERAADDDERETPSKASADDQPIDDEPADGVPWDVTSGSQVAATSGSFDRDAT